ncbi:hypothetical protein ACFLZ0_00620 [Patescibacteria group bacterium]
MKKSNFTLIVYLYSDMVDFDKNFYLSQNDIQAEKVANTIKHFLEYESIVNQSSSA